MKNQFFFLFLLCILISNHSNAQFGEWTWMHGDSIWGSLGNYGTLGVTSPSNEPPGVYETCEWTDLNGNLWIFGGWGNSTRYGAMWKYDVSTNEWTWMHGPQGTSGGVFGVMGITTPLNTPPSNSHGGVSWTDLQGNLWMFGGASFYNALWKYDIPTNQWTWMNGSNAMLQPGIYGTKGVPSPANTPGARWECAVSWTDTSGNLWMFGGAYNNSNAFNDVWKYDVATNEWAWMSGDSSYNQPTVYGIKGVEDPANTPGGRSVYAHWRDNQNNLWLFGGSYTAGGPNTNLNDLWRYNITTNAWTWMGGGSTTDLPGMYGTKCVADSLNVPGARFENRAVCTDQYGNFWMMGGGLSSGGSFVDIWNDLWLYCVQKNMWIWVSGNTNSNPAGRWGTVGVSDPANFPNGRAGASMGFDMNGNIFLFGGSSSLFTPSNDLWRFKIDPNCYCDVILTAGFTSRTEICPGTCIDFINQSFNATSYIWSFPGANPSFSTDANPLSICYPATGTYDVQLIANNANGSDTLFLPNYITVFPAPGPQSIQQIGDTLFALLGSSSYQWYYNGNEIPGATDYYVAIDSSGNYNVVATDTNGCEVEAAIFDILAGISSSLSEGDFNLFPNPAANNLFIKMRTSERNKVTAISIFNSLGALVMSMIPSEDKNKKELILDTSELPAGVYLVEVSANECSFRKKFVKE